MIHCEHCGRLGTSGAMEHAFRHSHKVTVTRSRYLMVYDGTEGKRIAYFVEVEA